MESEIEFQDTSSVRVSQLLTAWLKKDTWDTQELVDWLQGYPLPPVGYDEEPFVWILRGASLSEERYETERQLTQRLAHLLRRLPEVASLSTRPEEVLYNLLMLCAGLGSPSDLGEPLYEVFVQKALTGSWLGIDLRVALKDALIPNQLDDRLQPVWTSMLEGRQHEYLPGDEYDGFLGVLFLCKPDVRKGEPLVDEIGLSLGLMSQRLEKSSDRRVAFQLLIRRALDAYPGRPTWDSDLIFQADKNKWPDWAVSSLPSLCVRLDGSDGGGEGMYLLWELFVPPLDKFHVNYTVRKELCGGKVYLAHVPRQASRLLLKIALPVERRRLEVPLASYSAVVGAVSDMLSEAQTVIEEKDKAAARVFVRSHQDMRPMVSLLCRRAHSGQPASLLVETRKDILRKNDVGVMFAGAR
jgi:hypothetical protein